MLSQTQITLFQSFVYLELKLIESEKAHTVSFSKRKKTLFYDVYKFSTQIEMNVSFMFFSPSGELCPYDFTCKTLYSRPSKMQISDVAGSIDGHHPRTVG
ncbi:hypothetical protein MTR67_038684 [Solanum verrucosum]|uniref:MADS-box domain-containing protein n=1 Tax=Solanum verrucosum TaxID=315347 RepID=A0AAF0UH96_SOLVR|nr:hypothetical protein MTR67_038684 [Solanum verrucosum]